MSIWPGGIMWAESMRSAEARLILCWTAAVLCAASALLGGSVQNAFLDVVLDAGQIRLYLFNAVRQIFLFAFPSLLILFARPQRWRRFAGECRPVPAEAVSYGILLAAGGTIAVSVIASVWARWLSSLTGYGGTELSLPVPGSVPEWIAALLAVAVIPARCEELLFRGLLQGGLCRLLPRGGVWIAACVFAAVHGRWDAFPALVLVGWVLGKTYRYRGYFCSVLLHALYNGAVLWFSAVEVSVSLLLVLTCFIACFFSLRGLFRETPADAAVP